MEFDYDALAVLSAIVRTGSFEAAAKALNVTQSAVSQRIKQLEDKVGSVLVVRGRPCIASADGQLLCQHFDHVALLRHEVREQLSVGDGKTKGNIRIAVNNDSLATWFPDVVARAVDEMSIRLEILPDDQEFTEDRLRSGDALAIVSSSENPIPSCKSFRLGDMEYMAVASVDYVAKYFEDKITLSSVANAPSIRFDRKDTLPFQWLELAFQDTMRLSAHNIPSFEGHLISCKLGTGWAMMPTVTVEHLVKSGELVELVPNVRVATPLFWHTRLQASATLQRLSEIVMCVAKDKLQPVESE